MTREIKYSWFSNQTKGYKKAKRMRRKYGLQAHKIHSIKYNAHLFGILLEPGSINQVNNKLDFYNRQSRKLMEFEWAYKKGGYNVAMEAIKRFYTQHEIDSCYRHQHFHVGRTTKLNWKGFNFLKNFII